MMSHRFWLVLLFASLTSSLLLTAYLIRRPICFESQVVEQIDLLSSHSLKSIYSCSQKKAIPYDEKLQQMAHEFGRQIGKVERLFSEIGGVKKRIQVILMEGSYLPVFKVRGYRIILTKDLFVQEGALEKGLLKIWFRERFTDDSLERGILEESLTDLIGAIDSGNFLESHDTGFSRWPSVLQDLPSYCESTWKNLELSQFCEYVKGTQYRPSPALVDLSLRALLSQSMLDAYHNLDGEDKYGILQALRRLNGVTKQKEKANEFQVANTSSVQEISYQMRSILQTLRSLAKTDTSWAHFTANLEEQLELRGFGESPNSAVFDAILFVPHGAGSAVLEKVNELALRTRDQMLALVDENNLWMVPTKTAISRSQFKDIRSSRGLYFSCDLPKLETYLELAKLANKVLIVTDCRDLTTIKWEGYLKRGFETFASDNEDVPFVQLHLPSLMLALKRGEGNPVELLSKRDWNNPFFKNIGWQIPLFESKSRIYYAQSAISVIESFRLNEPNH